MSKLYGFDVASYNPSCVTNYVNAGGKFVLIKLTEGTGYKNPVANDQIKSAHHNHIYVHGYHFATFGASVSQAKKEAKFCIARAEYLGISKKRYIACDWETGDGNNVNGGKIASATAIIAFMNEVYKAGYKVLLYSGASLLRNNIATSKVVSKFGDCLWVASYATMGRIDKPNFNYFPSMDGVAIWQFTDNWCGLNVDGNISLIDLHKDVQKKSATPKAKPAENIQKKTGVAYAPIINNNPNWKIALLDGDGHYTGKYIKTNTNWKVFDVKIIKGTKCYKLGSDKQWAPAKYLQMK